MKVPYDLTIAVPVYNEEKTVAKILKALATLNKLKYEVIVVNDASTDKSLGIIDAFVSSHKGVKFTVINHESNRGKGAGIKSALEIAKGKYFVVQDADLEYEPADIPLLLHYAMRENADAVYGSRFLGKIHNMPKPNYIANIAYNLLLRLLYGVKMTDMHTCYKMVRTDLIKELQLTSEGFDYATELISKLLIRKINILEYPINFVGRTKQQGKKINYLDGLECLYKLIIFRVAPLNDVFRIPGSTAIRFFLVGGIGFLVNYLVLIIGEEMFRLGHVTAEIVAVAIALQVTFILHNNWTYRLQVRQGEEKLSFRTRYVSFVSSNAIGSLITVIVFGVLYYVMPRSIALFVAALTGLVWNYIFNKYLTWRPRQ